MEKGNGKYLMNMTLLLAFVAGLFYFMIKDHVNEVMGILSAMGTRELVALFVIAASSILICGLLITTLGRKYNSKYSIQDGVSAHLISNMFYSITPMGVATYPAFMYVYKKQKMNTEESISMMMTQTLIKQIFVALACFGLSVYFISHPTTVKIDDLGLTINVGAMCVLVCSLNFVSSSALFAMCLSKRIHRVLSKLVYAMIRVFFDKSKEDAMQRKFDNKVQETEAALKMLLKDKVLLYKQLVLHFIKTLVLYGSPYLIYLLLDKSIIFDMNTFMYWYAVNMFACYAAALIPVPGGIGAVELLSICTLKTAVGGNIALITSIIWVWRLLLHYSPIVLCAILMLKPIRGKERNTVSTMIPDGFEDYKK